MKLGNFQNLNNTAYNLPLIEHFIRYLIKSGKKKKATNLFSQCLNNIARSVNKDPIKILELAVRYATPVYLQVTPSVSDSKDKIKIKKRMWHKRLILKSPKSRALQAIRWMIQAAKEKKGKPLAFHLANEIIEASQNTGKAIKVKEQMENKLKSSQLHL